MLNLTATLPARLLSRYLAGADATLSGYGLDDHGFESTANPWAVLLVACTRHRGLSPFNLVDLFWKASDLPDEPRSLRLARPSEAENTSALERLRSLAASEAGYLAVQLGASDDRRRWPVDHFARAAEMLAAAHGLVPVLVGSESEKALAREFQSLYPSPAVADLTGATSLTELAATLANCRLLLTNDTGTMHLAAGLGAPIVSIFLATAQPWDTGPYLPGSICLEPDLDCHPCGFGETCAREHACLRAVSPEVAARTAGMRLGDTVEPLTVTGARVWQSEFQERRFLGLRSLSGHEDSDRTRWIRMQRHFYREFLDGEGFTPPPTPPPGAPINEEAGAVLLQGSKLLTLLRGQAQALAVAPRPALKQKFLASWEGLRTLLSQSPRLYVLGHLLLYQSQQDQDLAALGTLLDRYQQLTDAWRKALLPSGT